MSQLTDLDALLAPPAEREVPGAALARMRGEVLATVERDLGRARRRRPRLRPWLLLLGLVGSLGFLAGSARAVPPRAPSALVLAAATAAAPVAAIVAGRSLDPARPVFSARAVFSAGDARWRVAA